MWPWVSRSTVKVTWIFNIFDIHDLENVRIDTKINSVSCLQPEMRKVMQKGVWPWFSRSCNKDRIFSLSPLDFLTPKTYPWKIFLKNSDGKAKIQGGCINPLGRFRLAKYLGHLRVKGVKFLPRCNNVCTTQTLLLFLPWLQCLHGKPKICERQTVPLKAWRVFVDQEWRPGPKKFKGIIKEMAQWIPPQKMSKKTFPNWWNLWRMHGE